LTAAVGAAVLIRPISETTTVHSKQYQSAHLLSAVRSSPIPVWKRTLDILCCIIALPLLAFTTVIAAIITQTFSPGPILFRQERVGHRGRRFHLFKFRTMHSSADTTSHRMHLEKLMSAKVPMQKLDARRDSRLIPGGWLLRASGLDELPQIINVLRGEMSIVGPRPCIPYEYERYSAYQRSRLESVPGLTGLWQVSGKNNTTFEEMIELDIEYSVKLSFASDLRIIFKTVPTLCTQIIETRRSRRRAEPAPAPVSNVVAVDFRRVEEVGAARSTPVESTASQSANKPDHGPVEGDKVHPLPATG
jgi:exopolysaccharide production protein ExoY